MAYPLENQQAVNHFREALETKPEKVREDQARNVLNIVKTMKPAEKEQHRRSLHHLRQVIEGSLAARKVHEDVTAHLEHIRQELPEPEDELEPPNPEEFEDAEKPDEPLAPVFTPAPATSAPAPAATPLPPDPNRTRNWIAAIATGLGLVALARSIVKMSKDSAGARIAKFLGLGALATYILSKTNAPLQAKEMVKRTMEKVKTTIPRRQAGKATREKPLPEPTSDDVPAERKEAVPAAKTIADAIKDMPENTELLNAVPTRILLGGKAYAIQFKTNGIYIDGKHYKIKAAVLFSSVSPDLLSVKKKGSALLIQATALGQQQEIDGTPEEFEKILGTLVTGGTHQGKTKSGRQINIGPAN